MNLYNSNLELIEVDEKDCNLIISMDKLTKELGLKVFPSKKTKVKLRGKWYKILGGMGGNSYLKEI